MLKTSELHDRIGKKKGARVTMEEMLEQIDSREFLTIDTVTICHLRLKNGYTARGESACVDPANYDREVGERVAYDKAVARLWPLFGFLLAERLHIAQQIAHAADGGHHTSTVNFDLAGFEVAGLSIQKILRLKSYYEQHAKKPATDL